MPASCFIVTDFKEIDRIDTNALIQAKLTFNIHHKVREAEIVSSFSE